MDRKIRVGITQGDINGVGPEVIFKALGDEEITELFTPVFFGNLEIAQLALEKSGLNSLKLNVIDEASNAEDGIINLVNLKGNFPELQPGKVSKEAGRSAVEALEEAVSALKNGDIDVLVTAPISKEAVQSEEFPFPGHTEFLADRLGNGEGEMMILCNENLRVALMTIHIPVSRISESLSEEKIEESLKKFAQTLIQDFGIVRPRIAVLGLNPHAGDGGLLGSEEEKIIKPAIEKALEEGVMAFGPYAADGFFGHGNYRNFDGILAMYHDQGLAPFKTISNSGGVNFTASLPYVRTSPDHGTAFDIAWQDLADPSSMREAIYMAIDIFKRREAFNEASANPLKKHVHERPERHDRNFQKPEFDKMSDD